MPMSRLITACHLERSVWCQWSELLAQFSDCYYLTWWRAQVSKLIATCLKGYLNLKLRNANTLINSYVRYTLVCYTSIIGSWEQVFWFYCSNSAWQNYQCNSASTQGWAPIFTLRGYTFEHHYEAFWLWPLTIEFWCIENTVYPLQQHDNLWCNAWHCLLAFQIFAAQYAGFHSFVMIRRRYTTEAARPDRFSLKCLRNAPKALKDRDCQLTAQPYEMSTTCIQYASAPSSKPFTESSTSIFICIVETVDGRDLELL